MWRIDVIGMVVSPVYISSDGDELSAVTFSLRYSKLTWGAEAVDLLRRSVCFACFLLAEAVSAVLRFSLRAGIDDMFRLLELDEEHRKDSDLRHMGPVVLINRESRRRDKLFVVRREDLIIQLRSSVLLF